MKTKSIAMKLTKHHRQAAALCVAAALTLVPATPAAAVLLSFEKPTTASSSYGGWVSENAVDGIIGDPTIYWNGGGYGSWLTVDLGEVYTITSVSLWGHRTYAVGTVGFTVRGSETELEGGGASGWESIFSGTFSVNNDSDSDTRKVTYVLPEPTDFRYINFLGSGGGSEWTSLDEIEVYGHAVVPEPATTALIVGGIAAALIALRKRRK